jgi:septum formation protein
VSRLILASASPRRRDLLAALGVAFEVRPVEVDESPRDGEPPEALVRRLAGAKAAAIGGDGREGAAGAVVLAADTLVVLAGRVLGKPVDEAEARSMLAELQDREHEVLTGVAVRDLASGEERLEVARTRVRLGPLDAERIDWYVRTGEPMDKAGAYAIQGLGALLVDSIDGNYTNVVGLPLPTVRMLLADLGHDLMEYRSP